MHLTFLKWLELQGLTSKWDAILESTQDYSDNNFDLRMSAIKEKEKIERMYEDYVESLTTPNK